MRSAWVMSMPCAVADLIEAGLNEAADLWGAMGIVACGLALGGGRNGGCGGEWRILGCRQGWHQPAGAVAKGQSGSGSHFLTAGTWEIGSPGSRLSGRSSHGSVTGRVAMVCRGRS